MYFLFIYCSVVTSLLGVVARRSLYGVMQSGPESYWWIDGQSERAMHQKHKDFNILYYLDIYEYTILKKCGIPVGQGYFSPAFDKEHVGHFFLEHTIPLK